MVERRRDPRDTAQNPVARPPQPINKRKPGRGRDIPHTESASPVCGVTALTPSTRPRRLASPSEAAGARSPARQPYRLRPGRAGFHPGGMQQGTAGLPAGLHRYARTGVRSCQQLLTYLSRGGVPPRTASRLVAECEARGLVDDSAGVRLWADHWARRGYGWVVIRARLEARGFGARAIADAADRSGLPKDDEARARAVIAARRRSGRDDLGRLARVLAARGFDQDLIERLFNDATGHSVSS